MVYQGQNKIYGYTQDNFNISLMHSEMPKMFQNKNYYYYIN